MKRLLCMILIIVMILSALLVCSYANEVEFLPAEYMVKANVVNEAGAAAQSSSDGSFIVESDGWVSTAETVDCGELGVIRVLETTATVASVSFNFDLPEGKYIPYFWNAVADSESTTDTLFEVVMGSETVASAKRSQTTGGTGGTGWKPIYIEEGTNGNQNIPAEALSLSGKVSVKVNSANNKKSRIIAVKLVRQADEFYIIRNTLRNETDASGGTFEVGNISKWGDSSITYSCYNEEAAKQIYTTTEGEYVKYNFISEQVSSANVLGTFESYNGVSAGYYNVMYYDPYKADTGDTTVAQAEIYHSGETETVIVDTTTDAGWYTIAERLYFSGEGDEYVKFTSTDTKRMRMGAVKLEKCFMSDFEEEVKPLVSGFFYSDGKVSMTTNGTSITDGNPVSLVMVVAKYEKDLEQLAGVQSRSVTIQPASGDVVESIELMADENYRYKLFVLDSMQTLKPISEAYDF